MTTNRLHRVSTDMQTLERHAEIEKNRVPVARGPVCKQCGNRGFTGAPKAITDHGEILAIAFRDGVACRCAAGQEFALQQIEWNDPQVLEIFHAARPAGHDVRIKSKEFGGRKMLRLACDCGYFGQWHRPGFGPFVGVKL